MAKLKLGPIAIDKPVKVTLSLPGALHRDLTEYADVLARETGQAIPDPVKLVVPMLERFIATDRELDSARPERRCERGGSYRRRHHRCGQRGEFNCARLERYGERRRVHGAWPRFDCCIPRLHRCRTRSQFLGGGRYRYWVRLCSGVREFHCHWQWCGHDET